MSLRAKTTVSLPDRTSPPAETKGPFVPACHPPITLPGACMLPLGVKFTAALGRVTNQRPDPALVRTDRALRKRSAPTRDWRRVAELVVRLVRAASRVCEQAAPA